MVKLFRFLALPVLAGLIVGLAVLWWFQQGPGAHDARGVRAPTADSYADAVSLAAPAVVKITE